MDGIIEKIKDLEIAMHIIADAMRELGGNDVEKNDPALCTVHISENGSDINLFARNGSIVLSQDGKLTDLSYRRNTDV